MEGAGNDYVYINLFEEEVIDPKRLAIEMSHRHFGVGSDGLILIAPSQLADVKMVMFNSDGSKSEMCGNGIRCVGKYSWEHKLVSDPVITVETGDGIKTLRLSINGSDKVTSVSVEMGEPELRADKIPSTLEGERIVNQLFDFDGFSLKGTLVSMGNPHFITYVNDIKSVPIEKWGRVIEHHHLFPNRINVEFVQIVSRDEVIQRTWERGSGETWACGTGASAVCVAGILTGETNATICNHLTGGDLKLTWKGVGHQVIKEGPAREVFTGTWILN